MLIKTEQKSPYFLYFQLVAMGDYASALRASSPLLVVVFWLYLFCNSGNHLTQRFEDVADDVYMDITWYLLPNDTQKYLPLMLAIGQKHVCLRGFTAKCTRELFAVIMKQTFSFFMVLRNFEF